MKRMVLYVDYDGACTMDTGKQTNKQNILKRINKKVF